MKTVVVKAINLKIGDVLEGSRIRHRIRFDRRPAAKFADKDADSGIMVITPHPKGYDLVTHKFAGNKRVKVKRPACNMR